MIQSNLALKLEKFSEDYCNLRLVDNIIQFPISKTDDDNGNLTNDGNWSIKWR